MHGPASVEVCALVGAFLVTVVEHAKFYLAHALRVSLVSFSVAARYKHKPTDSNIGHVR